MQFYRSKVNKLSVTALLDKEATLAALQTGTMKVRGQFIHGSNYTFLAEVISPAGALRVVYKPVRGEQPLWDFPAHSLARREVAAFHVSEELGWNLVPATVYRRRGPLGAGSVQQFVDHDPERHYFTFSDAEKARLKPAALFDMLVNNADRKAGHILVGESGHFWLIDHGICFHVDDKLRTVIWDFAGQAIPAPLLEDVHRFLAALDRPDSSLHRALKPLLKVEEIRRLAARARRVLENPLYPQPDERYRPFPWPPV